MICVCISSATDVRVDWETYNLAQNDRKLVDVLVSYGEHFPLKDADGNEVFSEALRLFNKIKWERTHTPVSDGPCSSLQSVTVSLFNITTHRKRLRCWNWTWLNTRLLFLPAQTFFHRFQDVDEEELATEDACKEKEAALCLSPAKKNLISVHIRPHLGNLSDYPYCITPRQLVRLYLCYAALLVVLIERLILFMWKISRWFQQRAVEMSTYLSPLWPSLHLTVMLNVQAWRWASWA